jgi:hypothetical protein
MVSANRDMLVAIGGVFFLLPLLISVVVVPTPAYTGPMDLNAMADANMRFFNSAGPVLLVLTLPMMVGYLTLLVMLLDRDRPTVGTAIGIGIRLLPSYLAAQVLTSLALSVMLVVVLSVLLAVLPPVVAVLVAMAAMIYPLVRVLLIGPEMVAQRLRNPISAIAGGLSRTHGHSLRIMLYIGPALTLFAVIYALVMIAVGALTANVPQADLQRLIGAAIGAVLFAVGYTYYVAIIASTYDQLGPVHGAEATISPSSPN